MKNKRKPIDKFINDQLSQWPAACDNYRALKKVHTRSMRIGGLEVRLQFNPARIVSTAADVSAGAVRARKCFLCRENRPGQQISMKFEGRKSKKYDILVNPYPIFASHLVIASDRHVDQNIWKRYVDMLDLARALGGFTVFYNGPRCGASAPDHFHFQAASRGQMPLECDIDAVLDTLHGTAVQDMHGTPDGSCPLVYLTAVQDAELFHYRKFNRGIFVMRAATSKSAAKMFYRLLDCAPVQEEGHEPMFNLLSWYSQGEFRSVVIFRKSHRPHHYFSTGEGHLMISPGCADMAGVVVTPREEDFRKMTPALLEEVYSEVSLDEEQEKGVLWRLTRTQPQLSVGIMSAARIEFEILSDGAGPRFAEFRDGKIEYDGALYDELYFDAQTPSMMFAEPSFVLYGVTIGVDFHWERKENQKFAGSLKIITGKDRLVAVNIVGVEDYLLSVISSEMKSTASEEFLKAHAVISRSWVMSRIMARDGAHGRRGAGAGFPEGVDTLPAVVTYLDSERHEDPVCHEPDSNMLPDHVRWYGQEDHSLFDVCADDHCQRYQGLTRAAGATVRKAVDATWGQVLKYGDDICDARFSKCCGGVTERYSTCWEDDDYPYLQSVEDSRAAGAAPFCDTADREVLAQVLNDYDLETEDFFRWKTEYSAGELSALISGKLGTQIGRLLAILPVERGASGRLSLVGIVGTEHSIRVGKELEIRKILSDTHLKSSAFVVSYYDASGRQVPSADVEEAAEHFLRTGELPSAIFDKVVLEGRGWGHGVGLCQIGAAVMASEGYGYKDILSHYYKGAEVKGNG